MSKNNSGIILLIVLWTLAILSLLAMGLSKGASLEVALIRNSVGQLKAYAASRAGINYAQNLLGKHKTEKDTLYQCGIKLGQTQTPQSLFKKVTIDPGTHFDLVFSPEDYGPLASPKIVYGLEDEQGKIDLNEIDTNNYKVFSRLLQQFDVSDTDADSLAAAVVDWHSATTEVFKVFSGTAKGAKDEYYSQLPVPYKCKNRPFDHIEELLLVRGMTKEIFAKIKGFLTVFPKNPSQGFKINFNTASDSVLKAVVEGLLEKEDAEDIVKALIELRDGADHDPFTVDDASMDVSDISASQQLYINSLKANYGIDTSEFFQVRSMGVDEATGIQCVVQAVIHRVSPSEVAIASWHRE